MREIAEKQLQQQRKVQMGQRHNDLRRALRRGGAPGDVPQALGKRKRIDDDNRGAISRPRTGERPLGPQMFSIAT